MVNFLKLMHKSSKNLLKNDKKSFSNDRMQLQSTEKSIGSTKGEEIEVITTDLNGNVNLKSTIKYFTWKDNGVYYAIRFYEFIRDDIDTKGTVHTEINDDEISKIINSLKEPKQTNVINYLEKRNHEGTDSYTDRYIYDKDDLKEAENTLGFKPVLIKNSTLIPEVSSVRYDYKDNGQMGKSRLLFDTDYKFGGDLHLHLIQSKDKTIYDKVVNNEYYFSSSKMKDGMDITTDKLKINDIDVYKVKLSINNSTKEYRYKFERNGVYYELKNLNNKDDASTEASLEQAIKFILNEK